MINFNQQHKDLLFTLINQVWRLISGPITLLLIPLYLSPEQQGYWYLFGSLAALSVFADLGFSNIILQFSAHEYAFLHFTKEGLLEGEELNLKKLGSFFRFTIKWLSTICTIVFPIIFVVGIAFFIRDQVLNIYFVPWIFFSFGTLINFFNNSILSFFEGLNKIEVIQKIRFRVAVLNTLIVVIVLLLGGDIYALAYGSLISSISIFTSFFGTFKKLIKQLLEISKGFLYSWRKEVVPLFTKFSISFTCGYFSFQIYTPLMHYFHGPVYSGKVGITITLVMAIFNMSNIWMYTITPKINMLVSKNLYVELDRLFIKRMFISMGTYLIISLGVFLFIVIFGNFWIIPKIISRFLPGLSFLMLLFCFFIQIMGNSWAIYLRGHKQEPYYIPTVIFTVYTVVTTFLAGKYLPPAWFFLGFFTSYFLGTPISFLIYRRCKRLWHGR